MVTFESLSAHEDKIAIIGLGYVGLPLAVHLSSYFDIVGYDLKTERINELRSCYDRTVEVSEDNLGKAKIDYTDDQ